MILCGEREYSKTSVFASRRVNKMVVQMIHCAVDYLHFSNGISRRTRNDVESTANRQRAGGPLHLKDLPAVPMLRVVARP